MLQADGIFLGGKILAGFAIFLGLSEKKSRKIRQGRLLYAFFLFLLLAGCGSEHTGAGEKVLKIGAERLAEQNFGVIDGMRVGVITNHSAMAGDRHLVDLLHEAENVEVGVLFGPEHGIRGDAAAGEQISDGVDEQTGLPVYSLYGETRSPTPEMLEGLDALVFDIQDIGARFYTYISTMGMAMEAAARHDIRFVVLDRPNPLGGERVEGFVLEPGYESFVGLYPIPVTHGMTAGELALMIRSEPLLQDAATLDLHVVEISGWSRDQLWTGTGREWIPPSPNIPDFETALIYPGACFFEATIASEGRGTNEPFLQVGAPWIDGTEMARRLNERDLPGLRFEAVRFTPQSIEGMAPRPKLQDEALEGVRYVVEDPYRVEPVAAGMHLLEVMYEFAPAEVRQEFFTEEWLARLAGTRRLQEMLTDGKGAVEVINAWQEERDAFLTLRSFYLLYE